MAKMYIPFIQLLSKYEHAYKLINPLQRGKRLVGHKRYFSRCHFYGGARDYFILIVSIS